MFHGGPLAALGAASLALFTLSRPAAAYGEEKAGFPNWAERVIHQWTNRARVDPQAELQGCPGNNCGEKTCYEPISPLSWNEAANRAARFHADEMLAQNYFEHASKCSIVGNIKDIYPGSCQGQTSCACQNSSPTCSGACPGPRERVELFGAAYSGENIAWDSRNDPNEIFKTWIYERSTSTTCEFIPANGHRWNILKQTGSLGVGAVVSGKLMAVQNFSGENPASSQIPSGSHFPRQAAEIEAWANWSDGSAPKSAVVNIGGSCVAMTKQRGSDTNGAYSAKVSGASSGCHRYYFRFTDSNDINVDYPTTGTLGIGPQGSCADWQDGPHVACGGVVEPPVDGGSGGDVDAGGESDAGGGPRRDGGGSGGGGFKNADGGAGAGADGDGTELGGGGCSMASGDPSTSLVGLAMGLLAFGFCPSRYRRRKG